VSWTLTECLPASLEMSNFRPSTRMCSQSSDTEAARGTSDTRRGTSEQAVAFMVAGFEYEAIGKKGWQGG
jgi:hypothetical protein